MKVYESANGCLAISPPDGIAVNTLRDCIVCDCYGSEQSQTVAVYNPWSYPLEASKTIFVALDPVSKFYIPVAVDA